MVACITCFVALIVASSLFPTLHLHYLAPFLVMLYYEMPKKICLWASLGCGLFLDLLSGHPTFGIMALNYTLCTWILYNRKPLLFEDAVATIPLLAAVFSGVSMALQWVLFHIFDTAPALDIRWMMTDLVFFPLFDGAYALVIVTIPLLYMRRKVRLPSNYILRKRHQRR